MGTVTSNDEMTIGELARRSGVSAHTLRFYEAEGVLRPSLRAANGHRRYRQADVLWLEFVLKLKLTGMPLSEIKQYADLRALGDGTLQARLSMLQLHRQRLAARLDELTTCASALDDKIRAYQTMIAPAASPRAGRRTTHEPGKP